MRLESNKITDIIEIKYFEEDRLVGTTYEEFPQSNEPRKLDIEITDADKRVEVNRFKLEEINYRVSQNEAFEEMFKVKIKEDNQLVYFQNQIRYKDGSEEEMSAYHFKNGILTSGYNKIDEKFVSNLSELKKKKPFLEESMKKCLDQLVLKRTKKTSRKAS